MTKLEAFLLCVPYMSEDNEADCLEDWLDSALESGDHEVAEFCVNRLNDLGLSP